jgi:cellulose synthase/poly-beta-1,6-N-acetylglucosamine synthase-like glycosyltransferase
MLPDLLKLAWIIFQVIIGYNLVFPLLTALLYRLFGSRERRLSDVPTSDYGIIVTAYQFTDQLPAVVDSLLALRYPSFTIYVVADNCDTSTLNFTDDRVVLLKPETVLAGNTRSHFYAIRHFRREHPRLTIIDSDNLVDPEYLNELDRYFAQGFKAVQGVRMPKNLDTTYSCLDGARDIYYHFYDGKVLFGIGSSATLAGSGMAFTTKLYVDCLGNLDVSGAGFDKVLQREIVTRGERIAFAEHALVYDEKTSRPEQLVNQRARWINTWFKYFSFGFSLALSGILRFSLNRFLFGIVLLRPPLFMFLLASVVCMVVNLFVAPYLSLVWFAALLCFVLAFAVALISSDTDPRIYRSLRSIPKFIWLQLVSLANARSANKRSVSTQHYYQNPEQPK